MFNRHKINRFTDSLSKYSIEPIVSLLLQIKRLNLPSGLHWKLRLMLLVRRFEPESVTACKKHVHTGMNVLDAGAHVGYFSLLFSELVGPEGKVFAFEPHPETYHLLVKNIGFKKYRNIIPVENALSDENEEIEFFEVNFTGAHSVYDVSKYLFETDPERYRFKKKLTVDAVTLDDFLAKRGNPEIDFIKIDIEGAEPRALAGMKKTIERSKNLKIIVEFNAATLQAGGVTPAEFMDQMQEMGFEIKEILDSEGRLETIDQLRNSPADNNYANLLCIKKKNMRIAQELLNRLMFLKRSQLKKGAKPDL